jgi:8-oxo-dGTP pyrophosphatase MutT (NUDIX family)
MIRVKIEKDSDAVAKVVVVDNENRVLLLTRSDYHKKHAGELDLPGGHLKVNEPLLKGLQREVEEETGLKLNDASLYKTKGQKHYFYAKYDSQPIKLSREHTDYAFYSKKQLNTSKKFEKIAYEVLEMLEND